VLKSIFENAEKRYICQKATFKKLLPNTTPILSTDGTDCFESTDLRKTRTECGWQDPRRTYLILAARKQGFKNYIPLYFIKNYSPQVLKANMRVVGATEHALLFYRDKLPKFRNGLQVDENGKNIRGTGHMVFDWFEWERDGKDIPKIHPAQKPVKLLKKLIETFTDEGDVVIDPCFGSGSTGRACLETGRNFYGFEINKEFYRRAKEEMCNLQRGE
jgi:site-specific DNA-methyltransferase (adenine-specific)